MESDEPDWNSQWPARALDTDQANGRACEHCGEKFANSEIKYPIGQLNPDDEMFACKDCFPEERRKYDDWKKLGG
jgi:hypothetical protein